MSKKKHPEHVNHERWLVSYADFITLLFAFFVVLFASGQSDKRKQIKLAEAMHSAFAQLGIFDTRSKTPALTEAVGASGTSAPSPLETPLPTQQEQETAKAALQQERKVREELQKKAGGYKPALDNVKLHTTPEGLVISLKEAGFFDSGSAQVRLDSMQTLIDVAQALPDGVVRVEGHTDNVPIHTAQFPSNWELSSARAAAIARILLEHGRVAPQEMAAEGLAEFRPIAENDTEAGRAQNRRVDVVVLRRVKAPVEAASSATSGEGSRERPEASSKEADAAPQRRTNVNEAEKAAPAAKKAGPVSVEKATVVTNLTPVLVPPAPRRQEP